MRRCKPRHAAHETSDQRTHLEIVIAHGVVHRVWQRGDPLLFNTLFRALMSEAS